MTEKRFIANIDSLYPVRISGIQDTVNGKELTVFDEVMECLNHLHEENGKLKKQRDFYYARLQTIIKVANGDFE